MLTSQNGFLNAQIVSTPRLCRFERWNVSDEMINKAKTDYIAVSGPEAAGKREPLKKTGLAASICAFLDAHAPGVQVSPVVALQNMIRWGNFKPDALFCYHVGNTLSGAKTIMCVPPGKHNHFCFIAQNVNPQTFELY
jgi:hypothetical protein